jgi:phosphoglycolate phosphatase
MSFPIELKQGLQPVKLAIFDFDGTLGDTYQIFIESLQDMAIRYRFKQFSPDEFEKLRGLSAQEILKELHIPIWRVPKVLSSFRETVQQRILEVCLFRYPGNTSDFD